MLRSQQTISSLTPKDGYQNGKEKDTRRKVKREEVEKHKDWQQSIKKKQKMFLQQALVLVANKLQNKHLKRERNIILGKTHEASCNKRQAALQGKGHA